MPPRELITIKETLPTMVTAKQISTGTPMQPNKNTFNPSVIPMELKDIGRTPSINVTELTNNI